MSRNGPLALAYHALFVTFMLAPILVVCFVAFTPEGYLSFPTDRWSLRWFEAIGRYPEFISAFWRSLWLGALSSAIAVAISVPAALAIGRYRFPGREAMTALFMSPLMIPHLVLGIAFLRFFTQIGLGGTFTGLVLSHIVVVLPFALRLTLASAVGLDRSIEHAAVSLGASESVVLRRITLPLVLPGLVSGWALAFINSFDELTMTVFIAAPGTETLPVRMFLYIQDNIDPLVTSVSACVIAITVVALVVLDRALRSGAPARGKERRPWPLTNTMSRSWAAGWSASRPPGAWPAKAARSSCSTRATARCAPAAATSRWSGCRARGWASRPMPAGRSGRRMPGAASPICSKQETGLDVSFQRPGGFHLCLSEKELETRANNLKRLHNQPGIVDYKTEMLTTTRSRRCCPTSGPRSWAAASARSTAT